MCLVVMAKRKIPWIPCRFVTLGDPLCQQATTVLILSILRGLLDLRAVSGAAYTITFM